jgi:putative NIF3 family GTP cyclohydrolase 1 type 2
MGTSRQEMHAVLNTLLEPQRFQDFAPNGLQVEGRENIETVVSGVTASQALINAAVALKADAILVHHGYFWRSEDPC